MDQLTGQRKSDTTIITSRDKHVAVGVMATSTQQMSRANFRFVPLQDFSRPWTDTDLYAKYGLTEEERRRYASSG
jgi:hypothetical protein